MEKNLKVDVKSEEILSDVELYTGYVGEKCGEDAVAYDRLSAIPADKTMLEKLMGDAVIELMAECSERVEEWRSMPGGSASYQIVFKNVGNAETVKMLLRRVMTLEVTWRWLRLAGETRLSEQLQQESVILRQQLAALTELETVAKSRIAKQRIVQPI